ncbi:MAG: hypothetical protein ACTSX4_10600, partial [Candidatus Helarchaeota archaeon]
YLEYWHPKSKDIKKFLKELYKKIYFSAKLKIQIDAKDEKNRPIEFRIFDKKCPFHIDNYEVNEIEGFEYCSGVSILIECIINKLISEDYFAESKFADLKQVSAETLHSKREGEKTCIHKLTLIYEDEVKHQ